MRVVPSVISDYENGRRTSPGVKFVKRFVEAMLEIDESRGAVVIRSFSSMLGDVMISDIVIDMKEFSSPITVKEFCEKIGADLITCKDLENRYVSGYTIIDSIKAIIELSPLELVKLYGITSERALIFTSIRRGRSPMVAIKVTNLRPSLVVYHGEIKEVDEIARRIAEIERIPLAVVTDCDIDMLIERLESI
jgi:putative transcriptional regulator